jgi:hypothetical protein
MLTELHGKGGRICQPALEGTQRCPLIIRPTSEDVITGYLAMGMRVLNPRWWLPDLLNLALGAPRFRQQVFRRLEIEPWRNYPRYPRELLPWDEGSTQVDLSLTWENPPTTVFIEMKYGSDLSMRTAGSDANHGFPSDQLIRNVRVGLRACGWFLDRPMFELPPRDFVMIFCSPIKGHWLVKRYCRPDRLRKAIPHSDRLRGLPPSPMVGELSYEDIAGVLRRGKRWYTLPEQRIAGTLADYLLFKAKNLPANNLDNQSELPFSN